MIVIPKRTEIGTINGLENLKTSVSFGLSKSKVTIIIVERISFSL